MSTSTGTHISTTAAARAVEAAHADAVVFLADGRIVDHMADPTAERVLDTIKRLGS